MALAVTAALGIASASAEVVAIAWDTSGTFQRALAIGPGKFAEVCGTLTQGQSVAWAFTSDAPLNFNIHYHQGSSVVYPDRQDQVASLEGKLVAPTGQDYCWMWENKSTAKDTLSVVLRRQRD